MKILKVKELIEALQAFNEDADILIEDSSTGTDDIVIDLQSDDMLVILTSSAEKRDGVEDYQEMIDHNDIIDNLNQDIDQLDVEILEYKDEIEKLNDVIYELNEDIRVINDEYEEHNETIADLNETIADLNETIADLKLQLKSRLVS